MTQFDDKTVYILDSYGLIYRCYFAFISHPLTNSKGENVSALFGFFRNLHSILQHYKPSYIAAAMDSKTPTFRHKMFDQYKANRPKTPEDLHAQIPWICDVLSAMGIPTLQCDGYEADDIIATVASQCEKAGRPCRILSGDKDLMQLVTDSTQILKPDHNDVWKVVGPEGVKAEWGVNPDKMLDLLSLYGDTADNVPGVKGCGVKTACKFLEQYGSLDGIYEHADEIKGAIGQKIRDGKKDAYFSRDLIKLFDEVPCQDIDINKFVPLTLDYKKAADQLSKYQIPSCAKLYAELSLSSGGASSESDASQSSGDAQLSSLQSPGAKSEFSKKDLQEEKDNTEELKQKLIPLHKTEGKYRTISSSAELKKLTDEFLKNKKPVAIAVETLDKADYSSHLEGISLSSEKQTAFYIPFSDSQDLFSASGIEIKDAVEQIERLFDDSSITLIFHDMKYIYKVLRHNGLKSISVSQTKDLKRFVDTMIAYWLLSPEETGNEPYSLLNTAQKKIAVLKTDYDEIMEKGQTFKDVTEENACSFVSEKADITLQLWDALKVEVEKYYKEKLLFEMEIPLVPVLAEMELTGIHLDTEFFKKYNKELSSQIEDATKEIYSLVGHEFNISSTKQLQEVLFTERGLKPSKKTKTGYSTDTSVLEELAVYDPVPKKILEYRELTKLQSTYVESLPQLCDKENLIHTTFVQTGTATGRLSCKDPNLQNIPVRSDAGRKIRSGFTARKGTVFISADYSQIELVVMAHISKDPNMCKAFNEGTDIHKATASLIYKVLPDEVTPDMRRLAKTINFGVIYGMSAFRLSSELGISMAQAQEFIANYFTEYSAIQKFITDTVTQAHEKRRVSTLFGRTRWIASINNTSKKDQAAAERIAINTPIQGTAADIVKIAMLKISEELSRNPTGAKLLLQVHDELIFECPDDEETIKKTIELIKTNMETAVQLCVPLRVSIEYGKNWGEFH